MTHAVAVTARQRLLDPHVPARLEGRERDIDTRPVGAWRSRPRRPWDC
jgi:hypothetical protein